MKLKNTFIVLLLACTSLLSAQSMQFSGTITDAVTETPLFGVAVAAKGTNQGTTTDANGNFSFNYDGEAPVTLVFSYLGYRTQEVTFESSTSDIQLQMSEDLINLDAVVVTGQGIDIAKRRLSTNVVAVDGDRIDQLPTNRVDQLLQSELPNVQIRLTSGQPGTASIVRSRGIVSAFINSTPIIYVDGVRVDNLNTAANLGLVTSGNSHQGAATSALADIPTENIERIEFINGGAATTLYGSDAANGVIQIITKKGGQGRTNITLGVELGSTTPTEDFLFFDRTSDLLFQNGFIQRYSAGINGGNDRFGYSFAGSYNGDEGFRIFNQNENKKIDLRTGFRAKLNDLLTYRSSFGYSNNNFSRVRNGNAGGYTGTWFTESGASLFTGPGFNNNLDELSDAEFAEMQAYVNLAEQLQNFQTEINRFQTSQIFEYQPLSNLTFRATGGVDYRIQRERGIVTNEYLNHTRATPEGSETFTEGSIDNYDRKFLGITFELTGQWNAQLGDFSFVTTGGGQFFRNEDQQVQYSGVDVRDGATIVALAANRISNEFYSEVVNYGVYLQENIGFKNRYFVEFGLRGDGNSAFGDNIGTQYFPKVGASYIMSAEPFFEPIFGNAISYVKFRGNYGVAGNFPTPFANERTIAFAGFNGAQAAFFGQPGNDDLKPEKTYTLEVGADLAFLNDRVSLGVTYYNTETRDALFVVPLPPSNGEADDVLRNIGVIENSGFELAANIVAIQNRDWDVRVRGTLNTLDNEVTDAGGAPAFNINGFSQRTIQTVVQEGFPVGFLRGNMGIFDANGVMVETVPLSFLGSTLPDLFGNLGLNVRYKDLTFFASADYQSGAFAHSFERQFRFRYGASNEGIAQAEIDANGTGNWLNFTDQFVEETNFLKVRTMGLSYNLPQTLVENFARSMSLSFTVLNPLNFASSSFDPEATQVGGAQGQNGATTGGIAYGAESAPRQFVGAIRINF